MSTLTRRVLVVHELLPGCLATAEALP